MKKIKNRITKMINLTICFELLFMPLQLNTSFAQEATEAAEAAEASEASSTSKRSFSDRFNSFIKTSGEISNLTTEVVRQINANAQAQRTNPVQEQNQQLYQSLRLKPKNPRDVSNIFTTPVNQATGNRNARLNTLRAKCTVLASKGVSTNAGLRCSNMDRSDYYNGTIEAVLNAAEANKNDLEIFLRDGHSQGLGCYNKGIEDFEVKLKEREEELTKLENLLKERIRDFKEKSKNDLQKIKEQTALIEGKPEELLKEVDFSSEFQDEGNICSSFINDEEFRAQGTLGGYKNIESFLNKKRSTPQGEGFISAAAMSNSKYRSLRSELQRVSKRIRRSIDVYKDGDKAIKIGNQFTNFKEKNKTFALFQEKIANDIEEKKAEIMENLSIDGDPIANLIAKGGKNINKLIEEEERNIKNRCFKSLVTSNNKKGIDNMMKKFKIRGISNYANKSVSSAFKNKAASILKDDSISLEDKIKKINSMQKTKNNQKYRYKLGKATYVNGKVINASDELSVAQYFSLFSNNCLEQFEKKTVNGVTQAQRIRDLKTYNNSMKALQRDYKNGIAQKFKDQMIDCTDSLAEANSPDGCTDALNLHSENFCLKKARTCSSNIKACASRAKDVLKQHIDQRKPIITNYKSQVEQFKQLIKNDLKQFELFAENNAKTLDNVIDIGTVYNTPKNAFKIENPLMEVPGIPMELDIEDPEKYLQAAEAQISNFKKSFEEQRVAALKKANEIKNTILANYKLELAANKKIVQECTNQFRTVSQQIAQDAKANQEAIAKQNELRFSTCDEFRAFKKKPVCGVAGELGKDMGQIANRNNPSDTNAISQVLAFHAECEAMGELPNLRAEEVDFQATYTQCQQRKFESLDECEKLLSAMRESCGENCKTIESSRLHTNAANAIQQKEKLQGITSGGQLAFSICDGNDNSDIDSPNKSFFDILHRNLANIPVNQN